MIDDPGAGILLRNAFWWVCPLCSAESFAKAAEVDEAELREGLDLHPVDELPEGWEAGAFTHPDAVTCSSCGLTFELHPEDPDSATP